MSKYMQTFYSKEKSRLDIMESPQVFTSPILWAYVVYK